MPARRWSIPLEGDSLDNLFVARNGRIIASTVRWARDQAVPGGFGHITSIAVTDGGATTYTNLHAHRAYALTRRGAIAWTADEVLATQEAPDGTLIATNDDHELIILDRNGNELEREDVGETSRWFVAGWQGSTPIRSPGSGSAWVEPFVYSVFDHQLHRYDDEGNLVSTIPIPREPFEAHYRRPELTGFPDSFLFPRRLHLVYQAGRRRFIAFNRMLPAWIMSLQLDGRVDWVTLATYLCCNHICFVGDDVIVHTSSCGRRLSFLSPDGVIFRTHRVDDLMGAVPDGRGGVCATSADAIHGFDKDGEPTWTLECPGYAGEAAAGGILYTACRGADGLSLAAYDLR